MTLQLTQLEEDSIESQGTFSADIYYSNKKMEGLVA